jgi:hypothetical protein
LEANVFLLRMWTIGKCVVVFPTRRWAEGNLNYASWWMRKHKWERSHIRVKILWRISNQTLNSRDRTFGLLIFSVIANIFFVYKYN